MALGGDADGAQAIALWLLAAKRLLYKLFEEVLSCWIFFDAIRVV
jgi:hypothetical protein